MRHLTNEQIEELERKIQDEKVKQVQKRRSTKGYLAVLILLGLGAGWWNPQFGWEPPYILFRIIGVVISILVALWVYQDAKKRSMRAVVWALSTLFFSFIVVLYLLETQEEPPVPDVMKDLRWTRANLRVALKDLKAQNAELQEAKEALEHSLEREERGSNTLRGLAHAVKNPLSKIEGIIDIASFEQPIVEQDSRHGLLEGIRTEVNQARQTVNQLLTATAKPQFQEFDFQSELELLLHQTLQMNPIWASKIKLNKQIETIRPLNGDSPKLSIAFENLLVNACEAMEEDGGALTLKLTATENSIQTQIQDTGIGIAKENLPDLFKPLYTTKKAMGGTGLGMWITKQIIDDHKGEIWVESEVDVGTTVYVELPISQKSRLV